MKKTLFFTALVSLCGYVPSLARDYNLYSPDKQIKVVVSAEDKNLSYSVYFDDSLLMNNNNIGLVGKDNSLLLENGVKVSSSKTRKIDEVIDSPFYRFKSFHASCNEMNLKLKGGWGVVFRAYDDGVAYRFYTDKKGEVVIENEVAEFNFTSDYVAYLPYTTNEKNPVAMAYQNIYDVKPLSQAKKQLAFLPVTVDCGCAKVTVLESDLESYPGMFVIPEGTSLNGFFAKYPSKTDFYPWRKQEYVTETTDFIAKVDGVREYPWRIMAITENDVEMPVNNLVYALASENRIGDYSWVKPGKVAWDWWNDWNLKGVPFKAGINMDTYKYYIDFASANNIEYVVLDEGWYEPKSGDMLTVIPELNLPELVSYAKSKGVDIVLWTVFNVLDSQLEEACRKYSEMGVKGFKVDFLDRDDQTAVEMTYRIAEMAAKYHLVLDYHGIYKPTGLNRTYPNVINYESVFGMEEAKWSKVDKNMPLYDVTFPYIRMMAGYVDYTPGAMKNLTKKDFQPMYSSPASMGTRCHQLAAYIVHDSPFTMLCDAPTNYKNEQECVDFISSVPVEVDSTFIQSGKLGEYIVSVRKNSDSWFVGGMTNWDERDITVDFSFLPQGKEFTCTVFKDGVNANRNAEDYKKEVLKVTSSTKLDIHMASGGGFAMKLEL